MGPPRTHIYLFKIKVLMIQLPWLAFFVLKCYNSAVELISIFSIILTVETKLPEAVEPLNFTKIITLW